MIWIREEEVFTGLDYGSAEQRCRELHLDGLCGDVRREDPGAPPPLFYHYFCLVMHLEMARLSLDGAQEHLAA
jgi:hypothetical protein